MTDTPFDVEVASMVRSAVSAHVGAGSRGCHETKLHFQRLGIHLDSVRRGPDALTMTISSCEGFEFEVSVRQVKEGTPRWHEPGPVVESPYKMVTGLAAEE